MITLYATKVKESHNRFSTIITDENGRVKAIFNNSLTQPRRGTKEITINCFKYKLIWK